MSSSLSTAPRGRWLHRSLAWAAGLALLAWAGSGLLHPLISEFGVQQKVFRPPSLSLSAGQQADLRQTLAALPQAMAGSVAQVVRLVPGEQGPLLQVTTQGDARHYFALGAKRPLPEQDAQQAVFLARHYLAEPSRAVATLSRVDQFDSDYPAVNRLLPVWKVVFEGDDRLTTYVYTETGVLASVTDRNKALAQKAFQWLHTWSFLPSWGETGRVLAMGLLLLSLLSMPIAGWMLWRSMRGLRREMAAKTGRQARLPWARALHRSAGMALTIPLMALVGSGLYHLLQNGWKTSEPVMRLGALIDLKALGRPSAADWQRWTQGERIASLSWVNAGDGETLVRIQKAMPAAEAPVGHHALRTARFQGKATAQPAQYWRTRDGQAWGPKAEPDAAERLLVMAMVEHQTGVDRDDLLGLNIVRSFGPHYDFRNKRLPVWQVDLPARAGPQGQMLAAESVFIDPATGILADRMTATARPERYSFSWLHKWSFLTPWLGREGVNLTAGLVALCLVGLAVMGLRLRRQRRSAQ